MSTSLAPSNTKFRIHELGIIFCFYKDIKHIAFLNYKEGGAIYVGINKSGQAVGIDNIDQAQLQIKDRIKNNIQPSTLGLFDVTVETIDNKEVIKIIISSGTEKPYYLRKK